jgi:hypothetical protein
MSQDKTSPLGAWFSVGGCWFKLTPFLTPPLTPALDAPRGASRSEQATLLTGKHGGSHHSPALKALGLMGVTMKT